MYDYIVRYYPDRQNKFYQLTAVRSADEWKAASEAGCKIRKKQPLAWGFKASLATAAEAAQVYENSKYLASPTEYEEDKAKFL